VRRFQRLAIGGPHHAQVAELVDALVSGTSGAIRGGSSPLLGTIQNFSYIFQCITSVLKDSNLACICMNLTTTKYRLN
jgi:hypothetical protein